MVKDYMVKDYMVLDHMVEDYMGLDHMVEDDMAGDYMVEHTGGLVPWDLDTDDLSPGNCGNRL
jgi:hypothetical protein